MLFVVGLVLAVVFVALILTIAITAVRRAHKRETALEESGGVHADLHRQDPPN